MLETVCKAGKGEGCLHLLLRSSEAALKSCLAAAAAEDSIVLMGTGVLLLLEPGVRLGSDQPSRLFLHSADTKAHGLDRFLHFAEYQTVDDHQLVELVCRHTHCLSWK